MATAAPGEGAPPTDVEPPTKIGPPAQQAVPRRRRVPTSVIVTILGIGLSAWLIPAFTRQWDDRQKAHELQASLVTEMASATARALIGGEVTLEANVKSGRFVTPRRGRIPVAEREWSVASLRIEAQLRAYFSRAIVDWWQGYTRFVTDSIAVVRLGGELLPPRGLGGPGWDQVSRHAGLTLASFELSVGTILGKPSRQDLLDQYRALEKELLGLEERVASGVLASHPAGYSTTWHDLLRDLIP